MATTATTTPADHLRARLEKSIGHQYTIVRLLGRGGMGAVYLARDEALDRLVAIKVLPPESAHVPGTEERFRREAKTAARLTHPHIVPLHSYGQTEDLIYFVMGYVQGESLADRMERGGALPEADARTILADLAGALEYAHRQGVVHRDIKPDNVLIDDETGKAMLTDFGIAKASGTGGTLTEVGSIVGTPHYMSPEQASGERDIDGRSDIFSLGVLGYRMLSGRLPFDGENVREIIGHLIAEEPADLATTSDAIGADVAQAVMKSLSKDPANRWQSAAELQKSITGTFEDLAELDDDVEPLDAAVFRVAVTVPVGGVLGLASALTFTFLTGGDMTYFRDFLPVGAGLAAALPLGNIVAATRGWWKGRKNKMPRRDLAALALRPPKWWPYWWPAKWRRPGDVWPRLPRVVQRLRKYTAVAACGLATLMPTTMVFVFLNARGLGGAAADLLLDVSLGLLFLTSLPVFPAVVMMERWLKRNGMYEGLPKAQRRQAAGRLTRAIWSVPTHSPKWQRAPLRQLLLDADPSTTFPVAQAPNEPAALLKEIRLKLANPAPGARQLAHDALQGAEHLLASIEAAENEVAELSHDLDPQEIERLERKLQGMQTDDGLAGEMRKLTETQLELMRRMQQRLEQAAARRERHYTLLKTLWLRVSELASQRQRGNFDPEAITGKIRGVCEDIERHIAAAQETVRLLESDPG